jgi:hypothetical protein
VLCHGDKGPTYRKEYEQNAMKKWKYEACSKRLNFVNRGPTGTENALWLGAHLPRSAMNISPWAISTELSTCTSCSSD